MASNYKRRNIKKQLSPSLTRQFSARQNKEIWTRFLMIKQRPTLAVEQLKRADVRLAQYPNSLNFYKLPPVDEVTLMEFETFALDRLKVLRAVETARIRCKTDNEMKTYVDPVLKDNLDLKKNLKVKVVGAQTLIDERRKDHISHFVLRLAFCKTEDLRNWFVRQETLLFKLRFMSEDAQDKDEFIQQAQLGLERVTLEEIVKQRLGPAYTLASSKLEMNRLVMEIKATYPQYATWDGQSSLVFYKAPFQKVPELVMKRMVLLNRGSAYIAESERVILVVNAFRDALQEALEVTANALPTLDEDDRLVPVLNSLAKQYMAKEYTSVGQAHGEVTHDQIPQLYNHFPPCMQNLFNCLNRDAHLKHTARLQYGLFLKGIGLSLEEALIFWRKSFHRMTDDEFKKKGYTYNVRYNYGMEGKRTNYTPYSCMKIITNMPGPGEVHGCPFKHFSPDHLNLMLQKMNVKDADITEIAQRAREQHYQVACTRLFEVTRGKVHAAAEAKEVKQEMVETIEHPNQWYDLSRFGTSDVNKAKRESVDC